MKLLISFLVTSYSSCGILDTCSGDFRELAMPYGPDISARGIVSTSFGYVISLDYLVNDSKVTEFLVLDKHFNKLSKFVSSNISDVHSLTSDDNNLYIVSTASSEIYMIKLASIFTQVNEELYWSLPHYQHINSTAVKDNELLDMPILPEHLVRGIDGTWEYGNAIHHLGEILGVD
jgi:hypothetical protein